MKILLIDDHPLFRKGFALALSDVPDVTEILEASTAQEAFDLLAVRQDVDYIFLDLQLPDINGQLFLKQIRQQHLLTPVVVLSATEEADTIEQCLQAGACGYLSKASAGEEITQAILELEQTGYFLASKLRQALEDYRTNLQQHPAIELTRRQLQVLQLLVDGASNQTIATELGLSLSTVKGHVSTLYDVLRIKNRTQCVAVAREKKLI